MQKGTRLYIFKLICQHFPKSYPKSPEFSDSVRLAVSTFLRKIMKTQDEKTKTEEIKTKNQELKPKPQEFSP